MHKNEVKENSENKHKEENNMRELRKIQKAVKQYENLLLVNQENARKYYEEYLKDIEILREITEVYIDETSKIFQKWCDTSVSVFEQPENNIFQKIKRKIDMTITNHYLNKLSYELLEAGIMQRGLERIKERFVQYKYFT